MLVSIHQYTNDLWPRANQVSNTLKRVNWTIVDDINYARRPPTSTWIDAVHLIHMIHEFLTIQMECKRSERKTQQTKNDENEEEEKCESKFMRSTQFSIQSSVCKSSIWSSFSFAMCNCWPLYSLFYCRWMCRTVRDDQVAQIVSFFLCCLFRPHFGCCFAAAKCEMNQSSEMNLKWKNSFQHWRIFRIGFFTDFFVDSISSAVVRL